MTHNKGNFAIKHSQNEIVNKHLIQRLVNQSSITEGDLVYDIGTGSGAISKALLDKGARVVAFEKDKSLYLKCRQKLINQDRFEIYLMDFLIWQFPQHQKYKVFSNIPFFRTADIVNKLLLNKEPPEDCYLIVQKEAAEKYTGIPDETLASLLIKPLFWIDIIYRFQRNDFHPAPSVDVVLLQIEKRKCQLVPDKHYGLYKDFIVFCREGSNRTVKKSLKELFTCHQLKQLSDSLDIDYRVSPADLNFTQYLCLFQFYLEHNLSNKTVIRGAEARLRKHQTGIVKTHRTRKRARN
ncbi:MAG: rRNA adenine N(6)-methyltransferase family protein [Dehalococcoidales bacterium]|nr:MAG: rRNA adenine N(6)-methyltransferase family protein [Dehalococcoidales bacterium]